MTTQLEEIAAIAAKGEVSTEDRTRLVQLIATGDENVRRAASATLPEPDASAFERGAERARTQTGRSTYPSLEVK